MAVISEDEFEHLCRGIREDRDSIIKHNPIGTDGEILLWMLLCCLTSYLSLEENETPCFPGKPDAEQYLNAIEHIVVPRRIEKFNFRKYVDEMLTR